MRRFLSVLGFTVLFTIVNAQAPADNGFAGYQKLENNSFLKYLRKGNGTTRGEIGGAIFIKIAFLTEYDSVFVNVNEESETPSYPMRLDSPAYKGDFLDILGRMHVGDSITCFMSLDSLNKYYPEEFVFEEPFNSMKYLGMTVSIDSMYTAERTVKLQAEAAARRDAEAKAHKHADSLGLQNYIRSFKMTQSPNVSGIWYKETKQGTGATVTTGDSLTVHYITHYASGESLNETEDGATLSYKHGFDDMLDGWDIGISQMKQGGKAIFIVPSALGNDDGRILVFEVEIVSLNKQ